MFFSLTNPVLDMIVCNLSLRTSILFDKERPLKGKRKTCWTDRFFSSSLEINYLNVLAPDSDFTENVMKTNRKKKGIVLMTKVVEE